MDYNTHLIIVGAGELDVLQDLSNFIVHKTGYVSAEDEMAGYFSASDLFLYPTKADTLSTVLIESIACGTPCITFDIGGSAEIVLHGETGIVIEPFLLDEM